MASHCLDAGRLNDRPPLFDFGLLMCAERFRALLLGGAPARVAEHVPQAATRLPRRREG
jgi:hypothetical protein